MRAAHVGISDGGGEHSNATANFIHLVLVLSCVSGLQNTHKRTPCCGELFCLLVSLTPRYVILDA